MSTIEERLARAEARQEYYERNLAESYAAIRGDINTRVTGLRDAHGQELAHIRDELNSISRNMWAVVLAVVGMLGKFVLDRIGPDPIAPPKEAAAVIINQLLAIAASIF